MRVSESASFDLVSMIPILVLTVAHISMTHCSYLCMRGNYDHAYPL